MKLLYLFYLDYFANANESEPCLPGNHQIVETENTTYSVYNSLSGYSTVAVATNKWLLFRNSKDGSCDGVIFSNISQSICMQVVLETLEVVFTSFEVKYSESKRIMLFFQLYIHTYI